jgi:sugar/nucleoside kinase (ribokinase family)
VQVQPGQKAFRLVDIPGVPVKVKSLTGAGDVFAAAFFMKASERNSSALEAGRYANAVAALSLRELGAGVVPEKREVDDLLDRLAERDRR